MLLMNFGLGERQTGPNTCWAATLAWWLRAVHYDIKMNQGQLYDMYSEETYNGKPVVNPDGSVNAEPLLFCVWKDKLWDFHVIWGEEKTILTVDYVHRKTTKGPMMIGFWDAKVKVGPDKFGGWHVNAVSADTEFNMLVAMEPRTGRFYARDPKHYQAKNWIAAISLG